MQKRALLVYAVLGAIWIAIMIWQVAEHRRLRQSVNDGQLNRAHDIATSLAVVIRSQRRMGVVPRPRLVGALEDLAHSRELLGVALLSPTGEVVASGGQAVQGNIADLEPGKWKRSPGRLLVAALVELGPEQPPTGRTSSREWSEAEAEKAAAAIVWTPEAPPEPGPDAPPDPALAPDDEGRGRRRASWERWRQSHPFMQSPEKYRELYEKQGLHMMVLMLNDQPAQTVIGRDWLLRLTVMAAALLAVGGFAMTWRGVNRSAELRVRLARARAINSHLRELSFAAAGLAHETRNPLNLVRGIVQLVAKDAGTPQSSRAQLAAAIDEVDLITARLNEFIHYTKPREPRLLPVAPANLARDVARTLETDVEDKAITLEMPETDLQMLADPTMLRQVFFNLLLNAVQAVPREGRIAVRLTTSDGTACIDVLDNGPGVPEEARQDIFRPYFTLNAQGTGLGLAVVRQIVLAHGWDIAYIANPEGGSIFRISGIATTGKRGE